MSIFHEALKNLAAPPLEKPGDYRDKDGILYCGVCHCPKQMKAPPELSSIVPVYTIQCQCQIAEQEKSEAEQRRTKRRMMADEAMTALEGMGAMVFPKSTFAMDDGADAASRKKFQSYADKFDSAFAANLGLLLFGPPGSGKTFWASCIANKLIADGRMVIFTDVRRLTNAANDRKGDNRNYIMRSVRECDLLVLDDIGAERDSSYMAEQVFQVIDERYQAKRPMLITTNLEPSAMASTPSVKEQSMYHRILERCKAIQVAAQKRRSNNAMKNEAVWQMILGNEEGDGR